MSVPFEVMEKRPEVCPKGHPIWWFCDGQWGADRFTWWGVCSGDVKGGHVRVSGACRTVWLWCSQAEPLVSIDGFNHETLTRIVRELAHQLGLFARRESSD